MYQYTNHYISSNLFLSNSPWSELKVLLLLFPSLRSSVALNSGIRMKVNSGSMGG